MQDNVKESILRKATIPADKIKWIDTIFQQTYLVVRSGATTLNLACPGQMEQSDGDGDHVDGAECATRRMQLRARGEPGWGFILG